MQYDDKKSCVHCVSMHALGNERKQNQIAPYKGIQFTHVLNVQFFSLFL